MGKMVSVADATVHFVRCKRLLQNPWCEPLLESHAVVTGHGFTTEEQNNRFLGSGNSRCYTVQLGNILQILPALPTSPKGFPIRTIVIRENLLQQALTQTHVSPLGRLKS
jgi:hypothetical protein